MLLMLDEVFYSMAGPECTQPQWAYNGTIDEDRPQWEGCPLAVCTPQTLPAAVRNRGVCFRLVGPRQALVPFALRNRITPLLTEHFRGVCTLKQLAPRRNSKNNLDKRSYVTAVCEHYFSGSECAAIVDFYCKGMQTKKSSADKAADKELIAACQHMDDGNRQEFADLQEKEENTLAAEADLAHDKVVKSARAPEEPGSRAPAAYATPLHLRQLLPGQGAVQGCNICERHHLQQYQAFYSSELSGYHLGSNAATWGGRRGLSQAEALQQVVNWLRRRHKDATGQEVDPLPLEEAQEAVRQSLEAPAARPAAAAAEGPPVQANAAAAAGALPPPGGRGRGAGRGRLSAALSYN